MKTIVAQTHDFRATGPDSPLIEARAESFAGFAGAIGDDSLWDAYSRSMTGVVVARETGKKVALSILGYTRMLSVEIAPKELHRPNENN